MQYLYTQCYRKLANTFSEYSIIILKMSFDEIHIHGFHAVISEQFHDIKESRVCSALL